MHINTLNQAAASYVLISKTDTASMHGIYPWFIEISNPCWSISLTIINVLIPHTLLLLVYDTPCSIMKF